MAEIERPLANGTAHKANGLATTETSLATDADGYSVPDATEQVFHQGILLNPLLSKHLPADVAKCAAPISFRGSKQPSLPINWRFAESVSALKALEGALVNSLLGAKYNVPPQKIVIDTDHAQLFYKSAMVWEIDPNTDHPISFTFGQPMSQDSVERFETLFPNYDLYRSLSSRYGGCATNIYKTKDNRHFHLHGSLNPGPTIESIGLPDDKHVGSFDEGVALFSDAVGKIDSEDMQHRASDVYKQAGTICWTTDEFWASEHGKANAHVALFDIHKHGESQQEPCWWPDIPLTGPARPLAGLKVVDLTRIIAAPAVTRGLAELGASVMRVTSPNLPDMHLLHPDLSWGKWNCSLDLKSEPDKEKLRKLILEADIVVSGYRPGVMERLGFGPEDIFKLCKDRKRGIIVGRENCYGWNGPWSYRSGWQQISDANCGVSMEFGRAMGNDEPVTPVWPNSDFATGISGVCGILSAILRRGKEGGSYLVDLSLNYYSQWLVKSVGTYPPAVWNEVWSHYGNFVYRHYHPMSVTIPGFFKMMNKPGARGNRVFHRDNFEDRECKNLAQQDPNGKPVTIRVPKPILRFPDGLVKPGYQVGTRGNGVDAPRWPEDLSVQNVV